MALSLKTAILLTACLLFWIGGVENATTRSSTSHKAANGTSAHSFQWNSVTKAKQNTQKQTIKSSTTTESSTSESLLSGSETLPNARNEMLSMSTDDLNKIKTDARTGLEAFRDSLVGLIGLFDVTSKDPVKDQLNMLIGKFSKLGDDVIQAKDKLEGASSVIVNAIVHAADQEDSSLSSMNSTNAHSSQKGSGSSWSNNGSNNTSDGTSESTEESSSQ